MAETCHKWTRTLVLWMARKDTSTPFKRRRTNRSKTKHNQL